MRSAIILGFFILFAGWLPFLRAAGVEVLIPEANRAFAAGQITLAERLYRQAAKQDPSNAEIDSKLACVLAVESRWEEALDEAERANRLAPHELRTISLLAKIVFRLGKRDEALELLRGALAHFPQSSELHLNFGIMLADSSDPSQALSEFSEAVKLSPSSSEAHYFRARRLYELKRLPESKTDLEISLHLQPNYVEALNLLANLELEAGDSPSAVLLLQESLRMKPEQAQTEFLLGQELASFGKTPEAIVHWKKAVSIDPMHEAALYRLFTALHNSDPSQALRYKQGFQMVQHQRDAKNQNDAAIILSEQGRTQEAIEQMKSALKACDGCPAMGALKKNLGLIYARAGDSTEATSMLRAALIERPNDAEIQGALRLLRSLSNDSTTQQERSIVQLEH